jgi:hypothetical protein
MTTGSQYSRLPGRAGFFVGHSLWLGVDHVLSVRRNPFSESYRRYYFADIQAIVFTELANRVAPYGYTVAVLLLAALFYTRHPAWGIFCVLISLVAFLVSWRSADCACYVQTSVSSEMLPSLRRKVNAAKTLALLKAEIEKTQGMVSAEVLEARPTDTRARRAVSPKSALRHSSGRLQWIVFGLMVLRGAMASATLLGVASVSLNFATSGVGMLVLLLLVLAAIQQRNSDLAGNVRRVIYAALVFYIVSGLGGFVVSIYITFRLGTRVANQAMLMANPAIKSFELLDLIGFCTLGVTGLILMWRHQRDNAPPPIEIGNSG